MAATAITPYGWTLWLFLARTLGPRPEIAEWQGVSLVTVQGLAYLAVAGAGVTALFLTRRPRLPIDIMLIVCAVMLPFIAQRHLPLTVLIVLIFGGEHIASAAPVRRAHAARSTRHHRSPAASRIASGRSSDRFRPLVAAALLVEACVLLVMIARSPTTGQITYNSAEYPVEAVARLADLAADARARECRGPFQLGRIRAVARRAARQGVDGREARDGILGRRVSRQHAVHRRRR